MPNKQVVLLVARSNINSSENYAACAMHRLPNIVQWLCAWRCFYLLVSQLGLSRQFLVRFRWSDGFDLFKLVIRLILDRKSLSTDNQVKFSKNQRNKSFIQFAMFVLVSSLNCSALPKAHQIMWGKTCG